MGWDYTNRPKGISNLEWFRSMGWSDGYELLDGMTVGGVEVSYDLGAIR